MNKSKTGQRLLIYGAITLVYALFFKDVTTDGQFVNLNLLSQRQNLVIVGALLVLVGTILLAKSNSADKVDASTEKSEEPSPQPQAIATPKIHLRKRLSGVIQSINTWRPRIFFRVAFAGICSFLFMVACTPSFNPPFALPFLVFLALSMRNLPPRIAVSKTCFWAFVSIFPFNTFYFLHTAFDKHDPVLAILPVIPTLVLIGCYIKFSSDPASTGK